MQGLLALLAGKGEPERRPLLWDVLQRGAEAGCLEPATAGAARHGFRRHLHMESHRKDVSLILLSESTDSSRQRVGTFPLMLTCWVAAALCALCPAVWQVHYRRARPASCMAPSLSWRISTLLVAAAEDQRDAIRRIRSCCGARLRPSASTMHVDSLDVAQRMQPNKRKADFRVRLRLNRDCSGSPA